MILFSFETPHSRVIFHRQNVPEFDCIIFQCVTQKKKGTQEIRREATILRLDFIRQDLFLIFVFFAISLRHKISMFYIIGSIFVLLRKSGGESLEHMSNQNNTIIVQLTSIDRKIQPAISDKKNKYQCELRRNRVKIRWSI